MPRPACSLSYALPSNLAPEVRPPHCEKRCPSHEKPDHGTIIARQNGGRDEDADNAGPTSRSSTSPSLSSSSSSSSDEGGGEEENGDIKEGAEQEADGDEKDKRLQLGHSFRPTAIALKVLLKTCAPIFPPLSTQKHTWYAHSMRPRFFPVHSI